MGGNRPFLSFILQEDNNTPQESDITRTTAHQTIAGGVSLSQGFWGFCGVSRGRNSTTPCHAGRHLQTLCRQSLLMAGFCSHFVVHN
jgi:hypothetical protein